SDALGLRAWPSTPDLAMSVSRRMRSGGRAHREPEATGTLYPYDINSPDVFGTHMDALGHLGCMCGARGDKTNMLFYNGNRLSDMWSPYGLKKLGIENAPPFFTRGVLFDVQGLKGRVLDVGEEIQ